MKSTTAQRFGSLGKSFGAPSTAAAVIGAALLASDTSDTSETAWSPAAACLLPDVLPVAGTLLSYGGSRQLAAGGTVTHSGALNLGANALTVGAITASGYINIPASTKTSVGLRVGTGGAGYGWYGSNNGTTPGIGLAIGSQSFIYTSDSNGGLHLHSAWGMCWTTGEADGTIDAKINRNTTAQLSVRANSGFRIRNLADSADAALTCGAITASRSTFASFAPFITGLNESGRSEVELQQGLLAGHGGTLTLRAGDVANTGYVRVAYNGGYPILSTNQSAFIFSGNGFRTRYTNSYIDMGGTSDSTVWLYLDGDTNKSRAANGFKSRNLNDSADAPITCGAITASGPIQETPTQSALDPTTTNIPSGKRQGWYNSTLSEFRDWVNIGGTLLKSAAYT